MSRVYLGLGSNLGERAQNLREALRLLGNDVAMEAVSSFYETHPVGYLDQPDFVNAVCFGNTDLGPRELLDLAMSIETQMGRQPSFPNGPRLIDIDILSYGDLVLSTPELTIPHPRLAERAFVLTPLAEIASGWVHPFLGKTARELASAIGYEGVKKLKECIT